MLLAVDGVRVRTLRESLGMTQKECCERAGISLATLKNVEASRDAKPRTVRAIAGVLGVEPKRLASAKGKQTLMGLRVA